MSTPEPPARLVVITGLPGSGKTTLSKKLAPELGAVRMCPDDWMMESGIDLWDDEARAGIEAFQLKLSLTLLCRGTNVIIEWGVWAHSERDALRDAAKAVGASVELRYTTAPIDELWSRIVQLILKGDGALAQYSAPNSKNGLASLNHRLATNSVPTTRLSWQTRNCANQYLLR